MKSVKPGRGPSAMGVWGAVVTAIIGVFWTITTVSIGAPAIFPVFGILFVITGIISGMYHYKNATGRNRYSSFDITESGEEPDPLEIRFGNADDATRGDIRANEAGFCPYCGAPAKVDYEFCPKCGKRLPL